MPNFNRFPYISLMLVSFLGAGFFISQAFANPPQMTPISNSSSGHKSEDSRSKAISHSGYSHKKQEGSGSKALPHSGYSHKKSLGMGSKAYSHSRPPHDQGANAYGTHGYYGHSSSHHMGDPFRHVLKFKKSLGLTENQITQIQNEKFNYEKISIKVHADKKIAKLDLERTLHSENLDENKALTLAGQIGDLKGKLIKAKVEAKISIMKILTVEQRKKVSQMYLAHN